MMNLTGGYELPCATRSRRLGTMGVFVSSAALAFSGTLAKDLLPDPLFFVYKFNDHKLRLQ
jgi:hypothetical protein